MRSQLWLVPALLLVAGAVAIACGSGDDDEPSILGDIPTATPPAVLPDVLIVGQTDLPVSGARYTVAEGDTLLDIAEQFGTTVEAIIAANDIDDPTALFIGQELIIPGVEPDETVVAPTDEPEPTSDIQPTDEPAATDTPEPEETRVPVEGEIYIVQEGDIPVTIAEQFGITVQELLDANGITDPTSLQIGQELIIPSPSPDPTPEA